MRLDFAFQRSAAKLDFKDAGNWNPVECAFDDAYPLLDIAVCNSTNFWAFSPKIH